VNSAFSVMIIYVCVTITFSFNPRLQEIFFLCLHYLDLRSVDHTFKSVLQMYVLVHQ
jgi:hypothetical protein